MKYLSLLLLLSCYSPDEPSELRWRGTGYTTFGNYTSDTVTCEVVISGSDGTVTFSNDKVLLCDTLFAVTADGNSYLGFVRKVDTACFRFEEVDGVFSGSYGLDLDNGVTRVRHFRGCEN